MKDNKNSENYTEKPTFSWYEMAKANSPNNTQTRSTQAQASDPVEATGSTNKKPKKKLKMFLIFVGIYLSSALFMGLAALGDLVFDNDVIMIVGAALAALCICSIPIYAMFWFCKKMLKATKENVQASIKAAKTGNKIQKEDLSKSTRNINKIMTVFCSLFFIAIIVCVFLVFFTCVFDHSFELDEKPDNLCYDIYKCTKCGDKQKRASNDRKDNYMIDHTFSSDQCLYCNTSPYDYLATVIKSNGNYNGDYYEISGKIKYSDASYSSVLAYSPSTKKFVFQIKFNAIEYVLVSFSKYSQYEWTAVILEDNFSTTTVTGTSYDNDFSGSTHNINVTNSITGDIVNFYGAKVDAENMLDRLERVIDSYLSGAYLKISDLG